MNAVVTDTNIRYEGSLGLDRRVMEEAELYPGEAILVANETNGQRFVTYVIPEEDRKAVAVYGAAARLVSSGDRLIIMAFETKDKVDPNEKLPRVIDLKS